MNKIYKHILIFFLSFIVVIPPTFANDFITITTWNIEHLGTGGRGFGGGFGKGSLPKRTNAQLHAISDLIKNNLKSDILAVQEIAITHINDNQSRSVQLDTIVKRLGSSWEYYLPPISQSDINEKEMFVALIWNSQRVNKLNVYTMNVPTIELAGAPLYKRKPIIGYFEAINNGQGVNDFALVGVHLKSGQDFDENHLIAITHIERVLYSSLKGHQVTESDRIILGDFNDNPYFLKSNGQPKYSNALYQHMNFKKYTDLVTPDFHSTRMDENLTSIIDHILVNSSAKRHIPQNKADVYLPGDSSTFAEWRKTYSDHFPVSFKIKVESRDDDADY